MLPGGSCVRSAKARAPEREIAHFFFREAGGLLDFGFDAAVFAAGFFFEPDFLDAVAGLAGFGESPPEAFCF